MNFSAKIIGRAKNRGTGAPAWICLAPFFGCLSFLPAQPSEDPLRNLESAATQWIDVREEAARAEIEWKAEKEVLLGTKDLLLAEKERLLREIENQKSANAVYERTLENTRNRIEVHEDSKAELVDGLKGMEGRLQAMALQLPTALRRQIAPLTNKLGTEALSLPERVQNVVAVMSQIDQFNNALTLVHEIRTNDAGEEKDIRVLYWGLSMGFALNIPGDRAWLVRPVASGGWAWESRNDLADDISQLLAIYENDATPQIVPLPASLMEENGNGGNS